MTPAAPIPQCYTFQQIAERLGISVSTVRRHLINEPGVLRLGGDVRKVTLVPEPVLARFYTRHTKAQYNLPHADHLPPAQRQVPTPKPRPRMAPLPLPSLGGRYFPGMRTSPKPQNPQLGAGPQGRKLLGAGRG